MSRSSAEPKDNFCPYPVTIYIDETKVEQICDGLKANLKTSFEALATDINLYYCGYEHHVRAGCGKKNRNFITPKQQNDLLEKISRQASKLQKTLSETESYKDGFVGTSLNMYLRLAHKRGEQAPSISILQDALQVLQNEANRLETEEYSGCQYESTAKEWFLGKAVPLIYERHFGIRYSRAYNSDCDNYGDPHIFCKNLCSCLPDFKNIKDHAINSAPKNYLSAIEVQTNSQQIYGWPYNWTEYIGHTKK